MTPLARARRHAHGANMWLTADESDAAYHSGPHDQQSLIIQALSCPRSARESTVPAGDSVETTTSTHNPEYDCSLRLRHVLVPLDCSALAECIVPYVVELGRVFAARVTLLRVLEPHAPGTGQHVDTVEWEMIRAETHQHLSQLKHRLEANDIRTSVELLEGCAPERIIQYAKQHAVDLIALSSHGEGGLSGWSLSATIQKVVARTHTSLLVVPAYAYGELGSGAPRFAKILLPLDCSPRAECTLAAGTALAREHEGTLILAHVVPEPDLPRHWPLSDGDRALVAELTNRNREAAERYLTELHDHLAAQDVRSEIHIAVSHRHAWAVRTLAEREKVDLVLVAAHGSTGDPAERYGGVTWRLLQECSRPVMVVQDLAREVHELGVAEEAARGRPGH